MRRIPRYGTDGIVPTARDGGQRIRGDHVEASDRSAWSFPHADSDDYFWLSKEPASTMPVPVPQRIELMHALFAPRPAWVLSDAMASWGEAVVSLCDATGFLSLAPGERLRRLESREGLRRRPRLATDSHR